jgi:predicted porin
MKKLLGSLLLGSCVVGPTMAHDKLVDIHGFVSKETRNVSQESRYNYHKTTNVNDVQTQPSRVNVSGTHTEDGINYGYMMELGVTSDDVNSPGAVNVRLATVTVGGNFGSFTFGQDWTATSEVGDKIDSFSYTGLAGRGRDQINYVRHGAVTNTNATNSAAATTFQGIGYGSRTFKDLFGYKSPVFSGFQVKATYDNNDTGKNHNTGNATNAGSTNVLEVLGTYDREMGDTKLHVDLGYVNGDVSKISSWMLGAKVDFSDFTVGAMYQMVDAKVKAATEVKPKDDYMIVDGAYRMGKSKFAVNFQQHKSDTKATSTSADKTTVTQVTAGYFYRPVSMVELRIAYGNYKIKYDDAASEVLNGNKANIVLAGATVSF